MIWLALVYLVGGLFHDYMLGREFESWWGRALSDFVWPVSALLYMAFDWASR